MRWKSPWELWLFAILISRTWKELGGDTYLQFMDMKPQAKSVASEITSKVCQLETELWLRLFDLAETA